MSALSHRATELAASLTFSMFLLATPAFSAKVLYSSAEELVRSDLRDANAEVMSTCTESQLGRIKGISDRAIRDLGENNLWASIASFHIAFCLQKSGRFSEAANELRHLIAGPLKSQITDSISNSVSLESESVGSLFFLTTRTFSDLLYRREQYEDALFFFRLSSELINRTNSFVAAFKNGYRIDLAADALAVDPSFSKQISQQVGYSIVDGVNAEQTFRGGRTFGGLNIPTDFLMPERGGIVLARSAWLTPARNSLNEAFQGLQLFSQTRAGRALAQAAARANLSPAEEVSFERVAEHLKEVDEKQRFALAKGSEAYSQAAKAVNDEFTVVLGEADLVDQSLRDSNRRFRDLMEIKPISVIEAQSELLHSDEALILLNPGSMTLPAGQRRGLVIIITKESETWSEISLDAERLEAMVSDIRTASAISDPSAGQPPVPRAEAKKLFEALLGSPQVSRLIQSKPKWIIVPQGDLLRLPFAALVTKDPRGRDDDPDAWRTTDWLGLERSLSILPEVAMLRALRGRDRPSRAPQTPFFGVGDPAFRGVGRLCAERSASAYFREGRGAPDQIIGLCRLPETRLEVTGAAKTLNVGLDHVLLGENATEARVRESDANGFLRNARIVHFATHALIAGDIVDVVEPALALMPPTEPGEVDPHNDGLLKASEIVSLKLSAELVILSACNTAAGSDNRSEGLSGLAASFLYAGASALLVSQWPVRDDSSAILVQEALKVLVSDPRKGRTGALREAMRRVMISSDSSGASRAHPQDWAAFMLVGLDD